MIGVSYFMRKYEIIIILKIKSNVKPQIKKAFTLFSQYLLQYAGSGIAN
jgi:hypothetical protein